ncbi:LOW QUALITY PROTEIN: hypothetical protein CVT26_015633 [Gymnopilus dilepis]|uniref:Fork-head domain-containing protein n=1 Tax=Gymnopilus dilepis TaxID=231916 RepID=A0A409YDF0_9AGAR|nr:LOW QUALITY PROTEIN: hypothetical protein CVT26_015633 [Gymnopilus dilepis]
MSVSVFAASAPWGHRLEDYILVGKGPRPSDPGLLAVIHSIRLLSHSQAANVVSDTLPSPTPFLASNLPLSLFAFVTSFSSRFRLLSSHWTNIALIVCNHDIYSVAGAVFLFKQGMFFFFVYPEWFIYGGISLGVAAAAVLSIIALLSSSNDSAHQTLRRDSEVSLAIPNRIFHSAWGGHDIGTPPRVCHPSLFSLFSARLAHFTRNRKDNINWECSNGGQLYGSTSTDAGILPDAFCTIGFNSLWAGFIIALLIDLAFQSSSESYPPRFHRLTLPPKFYIAILIRRFADRVEHYQEAQSEIWKYETDPTPQDREAKVSSDLGWYNNRRAGLDLDAQFTRQYSPYTHFRQLSPIPLL